jgi:HSP20 family protein
MVPTVSEASAMDLYEEDGNLVAEVSLPNFKKDEVKVTTDEGVLEVTAEHKEEQEKTSKRRYYFHESSNHYFRRVTLPEGVKTDKTDASFKDGVLKVTMPMQADKKAKEITVK